MQSERAQALVPAVLEASVSTIPSSLNLDEEFLLDDRHVRRGEAVAWVYTDAFRTYHFAKRLKDLEDPLARTRSSERHGCTCRSLPLKS